MIVSEILILLLLVTSKSISPLPLPFNFINHLNEECSVLDQVHEQHAKSQFNGDEYDNMITFPLAFMAAFCEKVI